MSQDIDAEHRLIDLASMTEVAGAIGIDDAGLARIKTRSADGVESISIRQMPPGGWRVVRRR